MICIWSGVLIFGAQLTSCRVRISVTRQTDRQTSGVRSFGVHHRCSPWSATVTAMSQVAGNSNYFSTTPFCSQIAYGVCLMHQTDAISARW